MFIVLHYHSKYTVQKSSPIVMSQRVSYPSQFNDRLTTRLTFTSLSEDVGTTAKNLLHVAS